MEKTTLYRVDVTGIGQPNLDTVGDAKWAFMGDQNGREPEWLVMSPLAYRQLISLFNPDYNGGLYTTFMGLKLKTDGTLVDGEWRVRSESEQVYAIKG